MKLTDAKAKKVVVIAVIVSLFSVCNVQAGDNVKRKTFGGIGIGALAGALITGNVSGLAAGAAAGGVAGYAIGTDQDRHAEAVSLEKEKMAIEKEKIELGKAAVSTPQSLRGSTWSIASVQGERPFPEYHSIIVTFDTDSSISTLFIDNAGKPSTVHETYQIVNDVLVISGEQNGEDYTISGKVSNKEGQLIFVTPQYHIVAEQI